jgi:ribonuclease D
VNLPGHKYIASARDWQVCLAKLQSEPQLALDLEANSMYAYRERICLIQISIPTQDYLVDPLVRLDLSGLGDLLGNPAVEKIFHAAEYDLTLIKREYSWELNNLFDTMWAARILGYPRFGLANLLKDFYRVKLNKRYQKSNWCQRPLTLAQRTYAQLDTHYLLGLRDHLARELEEADRVAEAQEIFAEQTRVKPSNNEFTPDSFWSINGVYELDQRQQAVLKALNIYRDQEARRRNQPLFKIMGNKTLLELAQSTPNDLNHLRRIHGMTAGQIRRHGRQILQTVAEALSGPLPSPPKREKRPPEKILNRYDKLHRWRKNRGRARGVESDVILSREALWEIATLNPNTLAELSQIAGVGDWRSQTYGQEILDLLRRR